MKKVTTVFRWALSIAFLLAMIIKPELVFSAEGMTFAMANFITSSVTWEGKQNFDHFLRPMFIGKAPWETQGVKVMMDIQSTQKLNYFGKARKLLKAYVKGFTGTSVSTYTQRDIDVVRLKAEGSEDSNDFYGTVYEQALKLGEWDDLTNTVLEQIIMQVWMNAIESDIYRTFWLSDTYKETLNTSLHSSGTADTAYNALTGMWKHIFGNAAASPTDLQIYRYAVVDGAVAQVATFTLNGGSSANLVMTVNGKNYTTAYNASYTQTATDFVTAQAAALALRDITLTSSGAGLIFTSAIPGQPFDAPATASASTITGSNVATTANTAPTALASGESITIFEDLVTNCKRVLKEVPKSDKVLLVADDVYENYIEYLEGLGTERSHVQLENSHGDIMEFVTYRGIKVIPMGWGVHLDADFPHASGELYAYPHRVILTAVNNLILGMDGMSEYNQTRAWYNVDEQENRFRLQLKMGAQYIHNELMAVAY